MAAIDDQLNYRPISILPTILQKFKKHFNSHLMGYLNKHKLIHESQSGFRQKHSCNAALVKLIDKWMASIVKGDIIGKTNGWRVLIRETSLVLYL